MARKLTTEQIAEALEVDRGTILAWTQRGLPHDKPKNARDRKAGNRYDLAEVRAWMKRNGRTGAVGRPSEKDADILKLTRRKLAALVRRYERENEAEDKKLIDAAAEQRRDVQKITVVRNRLCGLGATLSPQLEGLSGAERQSLIDDAIGQILQEFSSP